jgi:ABC-2 type transport system permease protein
LAENFQYRTSALSGVVTNLVWCFIEAAAFGVFFKYAVNAGFSGGLTLAQTISYLWVREMLLMLLSYGINDELLTKITNGNVALEMCRPLDLYWHWFSRITAGKVAGFLMRGVICFLIAFLIPGGYGARLPASFSSFLVFLPSVFCAFLLGNAYEMLVTAIRTNTTWGDGPMHMMMLLPKVLSGSVLPLQLLPDFLQLVLLLQPFAGIIDIPARLYIGSMAPSEAWFGMSMQLFWSLTFIILGKWVMSRRLKSIVAQGG